MNHGNDFTQKIQLDALVDVMSKIPACLHALDREFDVQSDIDSGTLSFSGRKEDVESAIQVIRSIDIAVTKSDDLDERTISYLASLAKSNRLTSFIESSSEPILVTPKGNSIRCKTIGQKIYVDAILKNEMVLCAGPAGSGKTFLGVAMAVKAFRNKDVSKIILTRPAVEAGERLGFLPGDLQEKVDPYMRPIFDALQELLGVEAFQRYYDRGQIEVSPLAFMRGRTLDDSFILLDEAQNSTIEQMLMFLTRIGMNSKACICGDVTQVDLPKGIRNGLSDAMELLASVDGIESVFLTDSDIVRNPIVQRIIRAYYTRRGEEKPL
jgi:phosphate starvation-inducible PhoH-like protein